MILIISTVNAASGRRRISQARAADRHCACAVPPLPAIKMSLSDADYELLDELPKLVCFDRPIIEGYVAKEQANRPGMELDGLRVILPEGVHPSCIAFTPDDSKVVMGGWPNTIKIYRTHDGRLERTIGMQWWGEENELGYRNEKGDRTFRGVVNNAWSVFEDERGADEEINSFWNECYDDFDDVVKPKPKKNHHKGEIFNVAVSDTRIVTVGTVWHPAGFGSGCPVLGSPSLGRGCRAIGDKPGQTKLWDLQSGAWLRDLGRQASSIAISADQSRAAIALTPDVKIIALSNGDCLRKVKADGIPYSVALSTDNKFLFMHSAAGYVCRTPSLPPCPLLSPFLPPSHKVHLVTGPLRLLRFLFGCHVCAQGGHA